MSVIRQRANLKTGVSRKLSTLNFPKNEHFLSPDTHTYFSVSGGKKCSFFWKFDVLCFLEAPVLKFVLLSYYQRISGYETLHASEILYAQRIVSNVNLWKTNNSQHKETSQSICFADYLTGFSYVWNNGHWWV